jgi:hypothetical protein
MAQVNIVSKSEIEGIIKVRVRIATEPIFAELNKLRNKVIDLERVITHVVDIKKIMLEDLKGGDEENGNPSK